MVSGKLKIIWTLNAKISLKTIYDFYQPKSTLAAKKIVQEILETAKNIQFGEQYQVDEIDARYRRMIVRHFKILYSQKGETIRVHRVFDVRQNPEKMKEKY